MRNHNLVQPLEPRRLLAASFASLSSHGTLIVTGTAQNDTITVSLKAGTVVAKLDAASLTFAEALVKRISVYGAGGNDRITNATALRSTLLGSTGNDTLAGGAGSDTINGGGGHDLVDYTHDRLHNFDFSSTDLGYGGVGALIVKQGPGDQIIDNIVPQSVDRILLTAGDDNIDGEIPFPLVIDGGDGNDNFGDILGNALGEAGPTLQGGNGSDSFIIGEEVDADRFLGGPGNDDFSAPGPSLSDLVDGGPGGDTVDFANALGGTGFGEVFPLPPNVENMFGPALIFGSVLMGNSKDNQIVSQNGQDTVYGGGGDDLLQATRDTAGTGTSLYGGSGNDTLISGEGSDLLSGGSGFDTADYSDRSADLRITLDNLANDGQVNYDSSADSPTPNSPPADNVMADIETILGGSGNDKLVGNPFKNLLKGNGGNDTIYGGAGNDTLDGGAGRDMIFGQDGNDTIYAKDGRTDTLDGGEGFDKAQRDNTATIKDQVLNIEKFI